MNSDLLDVIVGVVFVWLLFSVVLSAVHEGLGLLTHVRAKYLWLGVGKLLNSSNLLPRRLLDVAITLPFRGTLDVRPRSSSPAADWSPKTLSGRWWTTRPARKTTGDQAVSTVRAGNQELYKSIAARVVDLAKPGRLSKLTNVNAQAFSGAVVDIASRVHRQDLLDAADALEWSEPQRVALRQQLDGISLDDTLEVGWFTSLSAPPLRREDLEALYEQAKRYATPRDVIALFRDNPAIVDAIRRSAIGVAATDRIMATRRVLEDHFERGMADLSRWYRRQSRKILVILAIPLVLFAHADTIDVYSRLHDDTTLRQAMVSAASGAVADELGDLCDDPQAATTTSSTTTTTETTTPTTMVAAGGDEGSQAATTTTVPDPVAGANEKLECVRNVVERANKFQVGFAWQDLKSAHGATGPDARLEPADVVPYLRHALFDDWGFLGRVITLVALMFGAQFWFDALRRLIGFRKTLTGTTNGAGPT